MNTPIFITGTDTDAGKTYVSAQLLQYYASQGKRTLGLKPIASGCEEHDGQVRNRDACILSAASSINVASDVTNPLRFIPPIAPHIAAAQVQQPLNFAVLDQILAPGLAIESDLTLIEGAGGWHLPLNDQQTMAEYVVKREFDIILVVGMQLGCINHALLTEESILNSGGRLTGWIANQVDPNMACYDDNLDTLTHMLTSPRLANIGHNQDLATLKAELVLMGKCKAV